MSRPQELSRWLDIVASRFGHLSRPQADVLGLWSFGIILSDCCGQTSVVCGLAAEFGGSIAAWRQRLRESLWEAEAKCGTHRRQVDVLLCFPALMRWIGHLWKDKHMLLAMDATTLGDRFTVLVISVLCGGMAIPVAWVVLKGNAKRAWKPHWERLMDTVQQGLPRRITVLVLADRGLSGAWLFRQIWRRRWHPLIRIKRTGRFRPQDGLWRPVASFAPQPGTEWRGVGEAFKSKGSRVRATLLAYWEQDADQSWLLITDLDPDSVDPRWYGHRAWIEQGFRLFKRAQWKCHRTRMVHPERVERLWLTMALATLWALSFGQHATSIAPTQLQDPHTIDADSARRCNRVRFGRAAILAALRSRTSLRPRHLHFKLNDPKTIPKHPSPQQQAPP